MIGDQLPVIRAGILNNIACEHCAAGSDITATELFHRALEIYTREQFWPPALLVASNLADIMMEDGRYEEAVQFLLGWERAHPEVIRRRLVLANEQIAGVGEFDYIIVNDDLEAARAVFTGILLATLHHRARRGSEISRVLAEIRAPRTP